MEIEKLIKFNEWWTSGQVKPSLLKEHKRPLFFNIQKYMNDRQILLISGLRRVGKTTLIYQIIQNLLDKNIKPEEIIYFSFDEEIGDFEDLIKTYEDIVLKRRISKERIYIFLDEVQKLKDWQTKIKMTYDLNPNIKFIISGSASVQINRKAKESLAGRIFDFLLEPLSFKEFLEWKGVKFDIKKIELYQREISPLFFDYMRKGGFPEIIGESDDEKIRNYIKNNIIERIIYKDLPEEFGVKDYELFKTIIEMIARQPGMIINFDALSRNLHKNKKTIMNYFFYLEYAMLIRILANYRENFLTSSRKMKKAYISNTAISFSLIENFYSDKFLEMIAENIAVIETNAKNYFHDNYEVDIILKRGKRIIPIEVKCGCVETGSMIKFLSDFKINEAIFLTKDIFDKKTIGKKTITMMPIWAFSLGKEKYI